jgi:hypothetical protein
MKKPAMRSRPLLIALAVMPFLAAPASAALPEDAYINAVMNALNGCLDASDAGVAATTASVCEAAHQRTE